MLFAFVVGSPMVGAVTIEYTLSDNGGSNYTYDYTVTNDDISGGVEEFTIWFDYTLYENLFLESAPTDWDPLLIQPDLGLPDDGFIDLLAFGPVLGLGETLTGLSISFDYLGGATPGSQAFDIIDALTFDVLASGETQTQLASVPLPPSLALFLAGLIVISWTRILRVNQ